MEAAIASLHARDQQLGRRRPQTVASLTEELHAMLESARTYREALDRYARVRGSLLAYERTVRPIMSGFDGLTPVFGAIRDERYTAFERLVRAGDRVTAIRADLAGVTPPSDLADVHATLTSALQMADYACARRKLSVATTSVGDVARSLVGRGRRDDAGHARARTARCAALSSEVPVTVPERLCNAAR